MTRKEKQALKDIDKHLLVYAFYFGGIVNRRAEIDAAGTHRFLKMFLESLQADIAKPQTIPIGDGDYMEGLRYG